MRSQVNVGDHVIVGPAGLQGLHGADQPSDNHDLARVVGFRFADVKHRGRVVRWRWALLAIDSSTTALRLTVPVEELRTLPRVRLRRRP